MRVLIAEDDPPSRLIHQMTVEKCGHECLVAQDGEEAWEIFRGSEVDVILSNWMMPNIDGLELCRRVRAERRDAYTYFILLSARGEREHVLTGVDAGADDYLIKPLDVEELKVRLISASRVTSLHRQLTEKTAVLQRLNRQLEELATLRADFTAMVAHELDTPLAVIRAYGDMLASGELGPEERDRALARVRAETGVLDTLVADVRAAATVEREDFAVEPRPVPVGDLLKDAATFAGSLPGGHTLVVEDRSGGLTARADRYRVGQVLRNLLSNAAKYSPEGAQVGLRAAPDGTPSRVRVEVIDRGPGVHPEDAKRIFEKFGRGRDPQGRAAVGLGLGLYLSRRILLAHGSELSYRPNPEGGSIFSFELETEA